MDMKVVTYCFAPSHFETITKVLPDWCKYFDKSDIFIGYSERQANPEFIREIKETKVNIVPISARFYGDAYQMLLSEIDWNALLILAPYVIPQGWLVGSLRWWLESFVLVGKFKPPRVLNSETILLPLIAPVIIELGRLNLDFLALRSDIKYFVNLGYREWTFGSILVRSRPGAQVLFNVLAGGYPVLTLPRSVKPVKYVEKRERR